MGKKIGGLFLIILMGVICMTWYLNKKSEEPAVKLIEQIKQVKKGEGIIEENLFQQVKQQIQDKVETNQQLLQAENFILGCNAYEREHYVTAKKYLRLALLEKNEEIRLYSAYIMTDILLKQGEEWETVEIVTQLLQSLSPKTYNSQYEIITELMQSTVHLEASKEKLIKSLEQILTKASELDLEVACDIKNKIAVLYFYNGNYARGMERFLEVIAQSEQMENKYYGAKAKVDLGIIYGALGNYSEAKNYFKAALATDIDEVENNAFIKTYALINMYENVLYEERYDEVQVINEHIASYIDNLSADVYESISIMNEIFLCNALIKKGSAEEAEQYLQDIESRLQEPEAYLYLSVHTNYILLKAGLAGLKGDVKAAIELYESLLKQQEDVQFRRYVLQKLTDLLNAYGYYEKANDYELELRKAYEEEALLVNMDYPKYALYKYEQEKKMIEDSNRKMQYYVIGTISLFLFTMAAGAFYIKYTRLVRNNKIDGLTRIYNRKYFNDYYDSLLKKKQSFSIIMFDIDHFKKINDTHGHLVGDEVIKKIVELSKGVIGNKGNIFRYGGEEFIIIIENHISKESGYLAELVREAVEKYKWEYPLKATVSLGVACSTEKKRDILSQADENLYKAKKQGRNQIVS